MIRRLLLPLLGSVLVSAPLPQNAAPQAPSRASVLRGEYGRYRANNDLLYYHLDIRVDPEKKLVTGKNTIRFKMLKDDTRIQIDLFANLNVDKILLGATPLKYERELNAVFIDFPETLRAGREYAIDFHYSGTPQQQGRFGGFVFQQTASRTWIFTACEGDGSSLWWPSKDQWRDEPESMDISVAIPSDLTDASNGRLIGRPIWATARAGFGACTTRSDCQRLDQRRNCVTLRTNKRLDLDYVRPSLDKARVQFAGQADDRGI
jgi:hypothetical protein